MRLLDKEREALKAALNGVAGKVYLFGSRTDHARRGGDIDLLVLSHHPSPYHLARSIAVKFRMACDERIDVLVIDPERIQPHQVPFYSAALETAVPFQ